MTPRHGTPPDDDNPDWEHRRTHLRREDDITLAQLASVAWRNKWLMTLFSLVGAVLGSVWAQAMGPQTRRSNVLESRMVAESATRATEDRNMTEKITQADGNSRLAVYLLCERFRQQGNPPRECSDKTLDWLRNR